MGSYEGSTYDPGSGHDNVNNDNGNAFSSFEFHQGGGSGDRAFHHRPVLASFSKPAPSKWDDAQKWLVSLSSGGDHHGFAKNKSKASNALRKLSFPARQSKAPSNSSDALIVSSSTAATGDEEEVGLNQDEGETKKIDYDKSLLRTDKPIADPASEHISYVPPSSSVRSVCMRDMGTDMTPIASQEPSRTGTPIRATTPSVRSPASSRPPTPGRSGTPLEATGSFQSGLKDRYEVSEKQTRQEIMALSAQLGKANIAAWASKEEEDGDASKSLKTNNDLEQAKWNDLEARAAAWEEAEQAKYMARYKREEVKIQAWENRQKTKADTEMRRIEVKVERMKSHAHERLMNKLAAAQRRAEEKRAAAEAKVSEQAVKTAHTADFIRQTGHMPTSFSSCGFSFFHCGFCH